MKDFCLIELNSVMIFTKLNNFSKPVTFAEFIQTLFACFNVSCNDSIVSIAVTTQALHYTWLLCLQRLSVLSSALMDPLLPQCLSLAKTPKSELELLMLWGMTNGEHMLLPMKPLALVHFIMSMYLVAVYVRTVYGLNRNCCLASAAILSLLTFQLLTSQLTV